MDCLSWLRARRQYLLSALWLEGTRLHVSDHGLHVARIDALTIIDRRIAELQRAA